MSPALPTASVRRQVTIPLRFADGYATAARVLTFDGLVDGREHLALGLGRYAEALEPAPHRRPCPWSGRTASASPATCSAASVATAARSSARRSSGSPKSAGTCCTCGRRAAASGCTASSTPTLLQDAGLDTYEANLALGHAEDERDYTVAAQMLAALDVHAVALLSNNPDKAAQLSRLGVTVTEQVPTGVHLSATNAGYLATKARARRAHPLPHPQRPARPGQRQRRSPAQRPGQLRRARGPDMENSGTADLPKGTAPGSKSARPRWWPAFNSTVRSTALTARLGRVLGIAISISFLTGLLSLYQYQPWSWLPEPASPAWGYRLTQGVHVATGTATIPLVLIKLWSVYPNVFRWPPFPLGQAGARAAVPGDPGRIDPGAARHRLPQRAQLVPVRLGLRRRSTTTWPTWSSARSCCTSG